MYDTKKYTYVEVTIDKKDDMLEQLIHDLEAWTRHLYPIANKDTIVYRGLVPMKEYHDLLTLQAASPYGCGYDIVDDEERNRRFFEWLYG